MNIPDFLAAAAELEMVASRLYETLAGLCPDMSLTRSLRGLSNDEVGHANAITAGRTYHQEMPDVFGRIKVEDLEVQKGIEEGNNLRAMLAPGYNLTVGLKRMIELERRFERIHIAASIEIADPSLKRLFEALTRNDKSHIATLNKLIKSQGNM
jgi:rubrerythrin